MGFCGILKVTKDFGTDPHPNPDPLVRERIRGSGSVSGSVPICHGSGTLLSGSHLALVYIMLK